MNVKKILSVALSAVLIGTTASLAVSAAPAVKTLPKTYHYVALGDSIAAGYGLEKTGEIDPTNPVSILAMDKSAVLTEDLIADPVTEAYPAVFGEYLSELGEKRGYEVSTVNMAAAAYSAVDIAQTIYDPDYLSVYGVSVMMTAVGSIEPLKQYHVIFNKYLKDADLVSIHLGGNDIIKNVVSPMPASENPIVSGIGYAIMMTLFGCDAPTAVAAGIYTMSSAENAFTAKNLIEAAQMLMELENNADALVQQAALDVKGVIDAVRSVNPDTEIALLNMYNPYGNSLEYDGQVKNVVTVMKSIFKRAAEEFLHTKISDEPTKTVDASALLGSLISEEDLQEMKLLAFLYEKYGQIKDSAIGKVTAPFVDAIKEKLTAFFAIVIDEIKYPLQYLTAGETINPYILELNDRLFDAAEEKGAVYVDIYGISNECNLDPHPGVEGHKEIAEIMKNTLTETVSESMVIDELVNNSVLKADTIKVGSSVKAKASATGGTGNYQYAFYYKKVKNGTWTRVRDYSTTDYCNIKPSMAAKYEVRIDVRDSAGTVVSRTLPLQVTSK